MMQLSDLVDGHGKHDTLKNTYTSMSEEEINTFESDILEYVSEEIVEHVKTQEYPTVREDINKTFYYIRVPESIRVAIRDEIDKRYPYSELAQKFSSYLTLCNVIGDCISREYNAKYTECLKNLGFSLADQQQHMRNKINKN
jgi:hypothetical protein